MDTRVPVVCNVDALPHTDVRTLLRLVRAQVVTPVLWDASVRCMKRLGVRHVLELGPGDVLTGLARYIDPELEVTSVNGLDSFRALSLDAGPTGCEGDGLSMGGALGEPDTAFDVVVDREAVKPALRSLPARDQRILFLRFFQDMTQNRIASELGLSQMQVSRLISHACARLREQTMRESAAPVPEEVARLKRDLGLRGRIDEAAGVLMAVGGLSPAVGRTALRAVAAKTGIKLGDVARMVVNWAHTGRLAGDISEALELELARRSPMNRSVGPKTGSTAACDERGDHATR